MLTPAVVDEASLRAMKVPAEAAVKTHRDAVRDLEGRIQNQQAAIRDLTPAVENNRKSDARLVSDEKIVSAEDLMKLRERRDAAWSLIRRRYVDNIAVPESEERAFASGDALLNAYETAVGQADAAADQRFHNAESTAAAMVLARQIADQQDALDSNKQELTLLTEEQSALAATWTCMWNGVTDSPLPPEEMFDWLDARADLLDQIAKRDGAARSASSLQQEIADAKRQLVGLLQDMAIAASAGGLPLEARIRTEEANAQKRNEFALDERKLKADVEHKRGMVESAEKEHDAWNAQWKDALAALNLSAEAPIETIQEQIDAIDQMRETSVKIADLQHERIGKIERDIKAFAADVEKLVTAASPQLSGEDAEAQSQASDGGHHRLIHGYYVPGCRPCRYKAVRSRDRSSPSRSWRRAAPAHSSG